MPTALGSRLGTKLGQGLGQTATRGDKLLYALTSFTAANFYATQVGGGEVGAATGGFLVATLGRLDALGAANRVLASNRANTQPGWNAIVNPSNALAFAIGTTGGFGQSPLYTFTASDVGKLFLHVGIFDSANVTRAWMGRSEVLTSTPAVTSGTFNPYSGATMIGARSVDGLPATGFSVVEVATARGTFSAADLTALFDQVRATGTIPRVVGSIVFAHKWPERALLKSLVAPASIPDAVTGAAVDAMTRTGSPSVVAIDSSAPRAWSYETQPIARGSANVSDANYWGRASTTFGTSAGFTIGAVFRLDAAFVGGCILSAGEPASGGTSGTQLRLLSNVHYVYARGNSAGVSSPTNTFTAADVGKLFAVMGVHDGTKLHLYTRRLEQGAGTTIVGFSQNPAQPTTFGRNSGVAGVAVSGATMIGWLFGDAVASLEQYQAWYDACVAGDGRIASVPGLPLYRYRMPMDGSTTLENLDGGPAMTAYGAPGSTALYARAWSA